MDKSLNSKTVPESLVASVMQSAMATDYRIGNIIQYNNENNSTGTITALIADFVAGLDYCQIDYRTNKKHWLINIKPIELSKDVIHKTKFFSYRWKSNYREIITYMNNDDTKCVFKQNLKSFEIHCDYRKNIYYVKLGRLVINLKYLHELQNLFFFLTQCELAVA